MSRTRSHVLVLYNDQALMEGRGWQPGDSMTMIATLPCLAEASMEGGAGGESMPHDLAVRGICETMFTLMNGMGDPDLGDSGFAEWLAQYRSMSVGDALVISYQIDDGPACITCMVCEDAGWKTVPARRVMMGMHE